MKTQIIKINRNNINKKDIELAANLIKSGNLVAFPTETVYGLGANGLDEDAVKKIYLAKGRPSDNPLILHIADIEELELLVERVPDIGKKLIREFWPGPLTIIFKKSPIVPDIISGGLDTVAIRMPINPIALKLIDLSGVPIAAPSANISGRPSPTRASHVIEDMDGKISMILDGGNTDVGLESTVIDLSTKIPTILRPGAISYEVLRDIIPELLEDGNILDERIRPRSPGQKYRHYAPKSEMILFKGDIEDIVKNIKLQTHEYISQGKKVGIMATKETEEFYNEGLVLVLGSREDKLSISSNLFQTIRSFDHEDVDIILGEAIDLEGMGKAIMNRMLKAAGGKIIKV